MTATTTASRTTATSAFHCRPGVHAGTRRSRQPAGSRHRARRSAGRTGCRAAPVGQIAARSVLTSKNDLIIVREGAAFMLHKTADTNRAQGGDVIDYTLDATNNGNADAQGTDTGKDLDGATGALRIDGGRQAVLLHDRIPAHTRLVSGSLETAIAGARRLWHAPGDAPFSYRSSEVANADEVAIALPAVQPNQSLRMRFGARGRRPCRPRRQRRRAELPRRRLARRRARASEQYRARDDRRSRGRGPDAGKDARRQFPRRPGAGIHAESPRDEPAQRRPDHRRRHAA